MIVLDASVLIGHFEPADSHHVDATKLLKFHSSDSFAASVITVAEIYAGAARGGQSDHLARLLAWLQIQILEVPAAGGRRLGELRAGTKLKMPDCCVLYTAEQHGAAIATFDERLAARAADLGLNVATVGNR